MILHIDAKSEESCCAYYSTVLSDKVRAILSGTREKIEINMEQDQDSWRLFQSNFQFTGIQNRQTF